MEYHSPEIPEGINTSRTHPLAEFAWLLGGVLAVVLALALLASTLGEWAAGWVSVEQELSWAEGLPGELRSGDPAGGEVEQALAALAGRLAAHLPLPPGLPLRVHYRDTDTVNAFATLGGNLVVYRGLLERMPHENALAMVLAHEIAHLARRHPVRNFGRVAGLGLVLSLVGLAQSNPVQDALGQAGVLTTLGFSRAQEREADRMALEAVNALYGHVGGATDLFRLFRELHADSGGLWMPEFASTHPGDQGRIEAMEALAREMGFAVREERVALGKALRVKAD